MMVGPTSTLIAGLRNVLSAYVPKLKQLLKCISQLSRRGRRPRGSTLSQHILLRYQHLVSGDTSLST